MLKPIIYLWMKLNLFRVQMLETFIVLSFGQHGEKNVFGVGCWNG